jgi:hypothetical protein
VPDKRFRVVRGGPWRVWVCRGCGRIWKRRLSQGKPPDLMRSLERHLCLRGLGIKHGPVIRP